jgi:hypothetical protein
MGQPGAAPRRPEPCPAAALSPAPSSLIHLNANVAPTKPWPRTTSLRTPAPRPPLLPALLERSRSRAITPFAPRASQFVVTSYWRLICSVIGMGSSGSPGYRARQRERERQRREQESRRRQRAEQTPATKAARAPPDAGVAGRERRAAAQTCGWCGGPITPKSRGTIPKWCSATCRHRAWEQTRAETSDRSPVQVVERLVQVRVPLAPTRRDWPQLLEELAGQLSDGRVYDRDLPGLARQLEKVLQAYRGRARLTGAPDVY